MTPTVGDHLKPSLRVLGILGAAWLAMASPRSASAQDAEAIKGVVSGFFAAMENHDIQGLKNRRLAGATLASVAVADDGTAATTSRALDDLIGAVQTTAETWKETITNVTVSVNGKTAHHTSDYSFSINGQRAHCGRVVVVLAKQGDAWLIAHIAETQRLAC